MEKRSFHKRSATDDAGRGLSRDQGSSLGRYLLLAFGISWISWGLEAILVKATSLTATHPLALALFIFGGFGPTIAGLSMIEGGVKLIKVRKLLFRGNKGGLSLLFMALALQTVILTFLSRGLKEGIPKSPMLIPVVLAILIMASFLFGGNEEIGWRGTMQPILRKKFSEIPAFLLVGIVWVSWHIPLWFIEGDSHQLQPFLPFAIFGICLSAWLSLIYKRSGALIYPMLFHGWTNTLLGVLSFEENILYYVSIITITSLLLYWDKMSTKERKNE